MTAPAYIRGRVRLDKRAIAARAARVCLDENVTVKNALTRFRVGRTRLLQAIAALRAERASGGRP